MPTTNLPQLDLGRYSGWRKALQAVRFLPKALETIRQRQLLPSYSYHLLDRRDEPVGVSAGDVCYYAREEDFNCITELVIALEDRRFYSHPGIDFWGILRALKSNLSAGRVVQGGSTITQQLVRNTLLTPDRSLTRKLLELLLALFVERHYTKREILGLYGKLVYTGPGIRGFQTAAKLIYRRSLSQLDADAKFAIVGLLRRPSRDYPTSTQEHFRQRKAFIAGRLKSTIEDGGRPSQISEAPATTANPIAVRGLLKPRWTHVSQDFCVSAGLPARDFRRLGLTVDRRLQSHLDHILNAASRDPVIESVAGVVLDNRRGEILAESAWTHDAESEFSPTFAGSLQPGSTFKPFAALAALEEGFGVDLPLLSAPYESPFIQNADGSPWRVRNYAFRYHGEVTLAQALHLSDNTAFARLTEYLSPDALQSVYERFGLAKSHKITPSIALGAVETGVSLLQIASAYAAIARMGACLEPWFLRFIQYTDGTTWWNGAPKKEGQLLSSYGAIHQLRDVLASTLPELSILGFAGKTGTTRRGSLVAAYNDFVSAAVWVGYKRPRIEGTSKGVSALKVLERFVNEALLGHSRDPFTI